MLSDYNFVDLIHPRYSDVVMRLNKEKNVEMLFSKVSRRRYQQIKRKVWDMARETLALVHYVAYTNVRGKKWQGTHSPYVCYGHHYDQLRMALGHYSLFPNTPDNIKKQVHEEIGNIVIALEGASRSVLCVMQSSSTFLDVKDKYTIPEVYDHKHLDEGTARRGFATQFCVGVNYWSSVHIDNHFYRTALIYHVYREIGMTSPSY
jgi:hypothetical protein